MVFLQETFKKTYMTPIKKKNQSNASTMVILKS